MIVLREQQHRHRPRQGKKPNGTGHSDHERHADRVDTSLFGLFQVSLRKGCGDVRQDRCRHSRRDGDRDIGDNDCFIGEKAVQCRR